MTTDKSSELKPCPFCGGEASQRTEHDSDMIRWGYIGCRCGVRTRGKFGDLCPLTWAEIRGEWNARAALPQQAQEAPSDDLRELGKWLNEEPNRPIDRSALARVLAWAQVSAPQQAQEAPRYMPIMGTPLAMPFDLLDERQAQINHSQSLARLAERGGLGPSEALAVVKRERWDRYQHMKRPEVLAALVAAIAKGEQP